MFIVGDDIIYCNRHGEKTLWGYMFVISVSTSTA
jgi:hypothetical protein